MFERPELDIRATRRLVERLDEAVACVQWFLARVQGSLTGLGAADDDGE